MLRSLFSTMNNHKLSLQICLWRNLLIGFFLLSFLPATQAPQASPAKPTTNSTAARRANIPYFEDTVNWAETAIFWFGINEQGVPSKNYADVRMAYTAEALEIRVTVIDYYLWYNTNPQINDDLSQYEAVAIYLDTNHDRANTPQTDDHKFLLGARHWQDVENYKREARGNGSGWDATWNDSWSGWGGMSWSTGGPNNNSGGIDYGWTAGFVIPWGTCLA